MNKVLIVDDSVLNTKILESILKDTYTVNIAYNGIDGISKALLDPPSLILLDIIMPKMDGFEAITKLKELPETKNIPVIFITGLEGSEHEEKSFSLGAADYITRPFSPGIVKARVGAHVKLFEYTKAIENLAMYDGLTDTYNRRAYDQFIEAEWKRAIRDNTYISIAMLDIDYFKQYNDNYGHLQGDEVLRTVSMAIKSSLIRSSDYFARYGGEEFVFVMPSTDAAGAQVVIERVITAINNLAIPHLYSEVASHVTVSIGGATIRPNQYDNIFDFVVLADKMLYHSKHSGRNKSSWVNPSFSGGGGGDFSPP